MASKHFANTGQILQLIVAVIALFIAGVNAYPSIAASNVLAFWPIVFYIVVIVIAFAVAYQFQSLPQIFSPAKPPIPFIRMPEGKPILADAAGLTFKMRLGERRQFGTGIDELTLVLYGIEESLGQGLYADLGVTGFLDIFQGGKLVKQNGENGRNRYLIPQSPSPFGAAVLNYATFSDSDITVDLIRINHINRHSGEIELTVTRCLGLPK
jgi:hypothetical protein